MKLIILVIIILIAVFFRFYNLSGVPPSPSLDEVTIGYNAYSILHTGRDEYGNRFPILLRAYDDWRPALYVYLVVPFVKLFGLNVLSVRLPSVIMSVVTVGAAYFLTQELFKRKNISFLTSFLLAVSPWHVYISRLGHEVNAGLTCIVFGSLFFLIAMNNKKLPWIIIISAIFFSLSFYTYQSEKVFTPLLIFSLAIIYWKKLIEIKKEIIISAIIGILITFPIFKASLSPEGLIRLRGTSAFSHLDQMYANNAKQLIADKQNGKIIAEILDNRRLIPVKVFFGNYFSHFNPYWLYSNSGSESFKAPGVGLFYPWELVFLLAGIFFLIKDTFLSSRSKINVFLLFSWIIIAFIAPTITTQAPHAMRGITVLPIPQIIEAYGIINLFFLLLNVKNYFSKIMPTVCGGTILILSAISIFYFYQQYFFIFPKEQSESFQYALAKANIFVMEHENKYDKIVFSNSDNLYQSYMFYLFAKQYDPTIYLKQGGTKSGGFAEIHQFGKYEFRPINWGKEKKNKNILYVGNSHDFPENQQVLFTGYYLDGKEGIKIIEG